MMKVFKLISVLYKIKLLSPISLLSLIQSIFKHGLNLMTLLCFASKKYGEKVVLVDDEESYSYSRLFTESQKLALCLRKEVQIGSNSKVAFLSKNHASLVKSIFATSRLGAELFFVNTQLSKNQFQQLIEFHKLDVIIYDDEFTTLIEQSNFQGVKIKTYHEHLPAINNFLQVIDPEFYRIPRTSSSKLTLFTSGTTGVPKKAIHKPTLFNYLNPFISFIDRLKVLNYHTAYIATPIYHGYGMAILLLFIPLGKKIIIRRKFDAAESCNLIREHRVEVITVVPTILKRLIETNKNDLKSLRCIASGGAKLNQKLINDTIGTLGKVLYNLYGTTEAGLNFIATPEDLIYSTSTIGKPIDGMKLKVLDLNMEEVEVGKVGQICIRNTWSMRNSEYRWIETGDLGYHDQNGYYFLGGRIDDMIISGGVNVYPSFVEQILTQHPSIEDAAVIGIDDDEFGQRLNAFLVIAKSASTVTKQEIQEWLRTKVSKFELPKEIEIVDELPYSALGKLDRKQLRHMSTQK
ncbi:Acyl-CoA synthetase (AMP-forming)/AMP-acid ligase II OS=Ureibacillus acetophenoni OX=614649 GN=SAMN05877842_102453 PE=3 SV=1 [Ureibacillus acetophenoni]